MSGMVERVAEAIALAGNGGTWDGWYNEDQKEFHRKRARAAIEALREPTDAMLEAGDAGMAKAGHDASEFSWPAMIEAALKSNVEVG